MLAERLPLLTPDGRLAASRVLAVVSFVPAFRATRPTASLGTWLEEIWQRLGGADCVDATAQANLDLLWNCLDHLPGGEQDLLGPSLQAALDKLTALPDPESATDCGVQLMTIHKSKGLEFEIVIVPDLQAGCGRAAVKCSPGWSVDLPPQTTPERSPNSSSPPLQSKGTDRSKAKEWVDRVCRERETQEDGASSTSPPPAPAKNSTSSPALSAR